MESSKTRGEDEGNGGGRCATAIVCTLVPPDAARWSARMKRKSGTKKCGGEFAGGKEEKWSHEMRGGVFFFFLKLTFLEAC